MGFPDTPIYQLPGIGPERAKLLSQELDIHTFGDLLYFFPFRYDDRTRFYSTLNVHQLLSTQKQTHNIQLKLTVKDTRIIGAGRKSRLIITAYDAHGSLDLIWFQGIKWITDRIKPGNTYVFFGKASRYGRNINMAHPEFELFTENHAKQAYLQPVYPSTEKLKKKYIDNKLIMKWMAQVIQTGIHHLEENLPDYLLQQLKLPSRIESLRFVHFPENEKELQQGIRRLKFEELFYLQLQIVKMKALNDKHPGLILKDTKLLNAFYHDVLPFPLTNAQKRVIKEIFSDLKSGMQMNRLLQGDVGSGKTVTAFIVMLIAISSGTQAALMAPTEILSDQHYRGLQEYAKKLNIRIAKLTGSTSAGERKIILSYLKNGLIDIVIGTHALLEDRVQFKKLGLVVIDEQHRFGVAQRARLWSKNRDVFPHVLVMTATPIPRTLAMTVYGDLDISVIDELPAGRKPIKTIHQTDSHRIKINGFLRKEIKAGRQVYIVYPLIEESEKLDLKHLMDGYESVRRDFKEYQVSILHGKMKPEAKDYEMKRFLEGETQIMVATTVIEVGVNVPNATVMVIENAERFGLAQLHQLRGRVGRGGDQSYCILVSDVKLTEVGKERLKTMVATNDGFEIAEKDLKLRGPGDITGTQQSGAVIFKMANLTRDQDILTTARTIAKDIIKDDPDLEDVKNHILKIYLERFQKDMPIAFKEVS